MTTTRIPLIVACVGAHAFATPARADDPFPADLTPPPPKLPSPYRYAWSDARMLTIIGVGFTFGGGITGFTTGSMRDLVSQPVAFAWHARVAIGTHIPLGLEINYLGSAAKLVTLSDAENGMLVGTSIESALRYTIFPLASGTPYVFAGGGWQRYDVRDPKFSMADTGLRSGVDVASFPLGAGVSYRDSARWVGDLRGTFRPTMGSSLLVHSQHTAGLNSWDVSASIGFEF